MEGYVIWLDTKGKWHTSHSYILTQEDEMGLLFAKYETPAVQVWSIPLPNNLPPKDKWFSWQRAKDAFRNKALRIAQRDYREHTLTAQLLGYKL